MFNRNHPLKYVLSTHIQISLGYQAVFVKLIDPINVV